ncbi:MAG TPA: sulfite exporter TauE/SafE family protein [Pseudomonadales bacterium]|nr:sulfite exporter TauE/SafE family protein [Pseudomonadales bacterium]
MTYLIYPFLGIFAGLLSGLLGVGGGIVVVPVLIITFRLLGFSSDVLTHMAVGTSLGTILMTSLSSVRHHHLNKAVIWPLVCSMGAGMLLGALMGAFLADALKGRVLQWLFGGFAEIIAFQMALGLKPKGARQLPGKGIQVLVGVVVGAISAVFGIGGGSLTVPYLTWCNIRIQQAVGTSAACGWPIALSGAAGFIYTGWNKTLPAWSVGYIYLPALVGIAVTSIIFAKWGAQYAHKLPEAKLKKIFSAVLALVGLKLLFG